MTFCEEYVRRLKIFYSRSSVSFSSKENAPPHIFITYYRTGRPSAGSSSDMPRQIVKHVSGTLPVRYDKKR